VHVCVVVMTSLNALEQLGNSTGTNMLLVCGFIVIGVSTPTTAQSSHSLLPSASCWGSLPSHQSTEFVRVPNQEVVEIVCEPGPC
jgi:hypothetical protein